MTCEEARKNCRCFLYGELSFEDEEMVEVHMDECAACREALAREKAMFRSLDRGSDAGRGAAGGCRAELRRERSAHVEPFGTCGAEGGFWSKLRAGFTIHFHFAPGCRHGR